MSYLYKIIPSVFVGATEITMLEVAKYGNGRMAVQLYSIIDKNDGGNGVAVEPWDTLSVNLPDESLPEDSFFVRNYDHHIKTYIAMVHAGIIELVDGLTGHVGMHGTCGVARLTKKATANIVE